MDPDSYRDMLERLNDHRIEEVRFSIEGYGHYRDCVLRHFYEYLPALGKKAHLGIEAVLSRDERAMFHGPFKDEMKIFHLGKEGKKSLRYLMKRIVVTSIVENGGEG